MRLEQPVEKPEVLREASHVRGDPRHREAVQRAAQRRVVVELRAVLLAIGVLRGEPGVGVRHVGHADHPEPLGQTHLLEAHLPVEREELLVARLEPEVDEAGRVPELHDARAEFAILLDPREVVRSMPVALVLVHEVGDRDELDGVAEALAHRWHILETRHREGLLDAV